MDGIPMLRAAAYWPIIPAMQEIGVPVQRHMAAAHVPEEAMSQPELLLPERPAWELFDRVREIEGVDDIGFRIGASHSVLDVPGLARPLSGHPNLLQLMKAFCNQLKGHSNCWIYWINRVPDGVQLCRQSSPIEVGQWPMEQYAIGYLTDLVSMAAPKGWRPSRIWLQTEKQALRSDRKWLHDAEVYFGQTNTAVHVPQEFLALPVSDIESSRFPMRTKPIEVSFLTNLRQIIRAYINQPAFGLADLADLTGMHPRTLQRRLDRYHDTSFRKILGQTRFELAREMLGEPDARISDVASDLGYRSVAAFSKEFRKWAGISPRRYCRPQR